MKSKWILTGGLILIGVVSFSISYFVTTQNSKITDVHIKPQQKQEQKQPHPVQAPKIRYTVIQPTKKQVAEAKAEYQAYLEHLKIVPGKQIASFHTSLNGDNASGRVQNIILACKKINDTILMPGERFSFNQATGNSNNPANGWKHAIEIDNNKLVVGYGGGICQVSTTIYNSVNKANLQINERHMHSLSVPYVAHGKDATVDYPDLDFKFTNTLQTPIRIQTLVQGNDVISSIYSLPVYKNISKNE